MREQLAATDEAVPRIEFDFAELGREEDQTLPFLSLNAVDVGSQSLLAGLCPTKALSEYLVETILAFVEILGRKHGHAAFRPGTCAGTAIEGSTEQTSQTNTGETRSKRQPSKPGQD